MDPRDPTVPRDLRATAREVASDYPQIGWFAELVVDEIDRLRDRLSAVERLHASSEGGEAVLDAHAADLIDIYGRIDRVRALCDLADWAETSVGGHSRPSVLVEDIRAALVPRR
jgi:hypothetical protein